MKNYDSFVRAALAEARKARDKDEAPIGAVIVHDGKIIARAHNLRETKQNALHHAELLAIAKACKKLNSWRLVDCEVYVTLEPCPMCAGALQQARVREVYFCADDKKAGVVSLGIPIHAHPKLNHRFKITRLEGYPECGEILSQFFKAKRRPKRR